MRAPAPYAAEVLAGLAAEAGIALPPPQALPGGGAGAELAGIDSPPLAPMLRQMLRYSTNLTAEVVGLRASQVRGLAPDGPAASAAAMGDWARERFGLASARLVDHSGLGDGSRIAPAELVAVLARADGLAAMLRERPVTGPDRQPVDLGVRVVAKTGTLFFSCGLAGYMTGSRRLVFAILASDPALRSAIRPEDRARPPGSKAWAARARAQEQALLRRWASLYAA